jgi:hypothetical protein
MANESRNEDQERAAQGPCSCVTDPFGAVPAELRPEPRKKGSLRRIQCPGCGKEYWTNRETDLCLDCEKSRAHEPLSQA